MTEIEKEYEAEMALIQTEYDAALLTLEQEYQTKLALFQKEYEDILADLEKEYQIRMKGSTKPSRWLRVFGR